MIADGIEAQNLEELQIVKFNQTKPGVASELLPLGKLKKLERLNLSSTWFPLDLKRNEPDTDAAEVSGARDFERIIWLVKGTLKNLQIGNYIWDDLFVYLATMCKQIELL